MKGGLRGLGTLAGKERTETKVIGENGAGGGQLTGRHHAGAWQLCEGFRRGQTS